jgi:hypothetical protein
VIASRTTRNAERQKGSETGIYKGWSITRDVAFSGRTRRAFRKHPETIPAAPGQRSGNTRRRFWRNADNVPDAPGDDSGVTRTAERDELMAS